MKIYYNSSLWGEGKGFWGWPQRTNWKFEYAEAVRYIPTIYRFPKGVVFDVITILDEKELREFFRKYEMYKTNEEALTALQRRCIEQEHPYQSVPISEIWINEKQVKDGYSASRSIRIPWIQQDDKLVYIKKAYSNILKGVACFACERYCVPYPEIDSKIQKLLRYFGLYWVKEIGFLTYPVQWFFPLDISFQMSVDEKKRFALITL